MLLEQEGEHLLDLDELDGVLVLVDEEVEDEEFAVVLGAVAVDEQTVEPLQGLQVEEPLVVLQREGPPHSLGQLVLLPDHLPEEVEVRVEHFPGDVVVVVVNYALIYL